MKHTLLSIALLGGLFGTASTPERALQAYESESYAEAIVLFDSASTEEAYESQRRELMYNMGQSWYNLDSMAKARAFMSKVTGMGDEKTASREAKQLASRAWNNIGVIQATEKGQAEPGQGAPPQGMNVPPQGQNGEGNATVEALQQALAAWKSALKLDHDNETARYNYELALKLLQSQQDQEQEQEDEEQEENEDQQEENKENEENKQDDQQNQEDKQNKPQEKPQPDNKENKGQQKSQQNQKKGDAADQEMGLQQAKQLLNAMNEKEKQFIQQLEKRKQKASPYNHDGPDW